MDKEVIKLLVKALKQRPEEQPINYQGIPDLPTLQMDEQILQTQPQSEPKELHIPQDQGLSASLRGLIYQNEMGNLKLNQKGLMLDSPYLRGKIGADKGYNVSGTIPIEDGKITASYASDSEEGRNFRLQLAKKLMGGDLSVGVNNSSGDRSYNMQYQRKF